MVQTLLNNKADLEAETKYQSSPLHIAAEKGHVGVVQILLNKNKSNK